MVYEPIVFGSTVSPPTTMFEVMSPSSGSEAVAPGSVKAEPTTIVIGLSPSKVMTGFWFSYMSIAAQTGRILFGLLLSG